MRRIPYIILILMAFYHAGTFAQLTRGGKPLVPGTQKSGFEWIQLDQVHTGDLMLEDEWAAPSSPLAGPD